ncbi:DUF951 domain-containing protein [Ruminococcus callidus]|jgi:hypothetical protein|uniref:DUF951 domain-containing protein n=3 Tax=Oscillospiraceae TaxID=216572 RepID=UPI0039B06E7B
MIYLRARKMERMEWNMDVRPGDILTMKKPHPCGCNTMHVIRSGMDFKLQCTKCGREFMVPRNKIERYIKKIQRDAVED